MPNSPQFEVGDPRRSKECLDQIDALVENAIDVMVTEGWDIAEVLEAAEASLARRWRSSEVDPDPQDSEAEISGRPIPEAPRAG